MEILKRVLGRKKTTTVKEVTVPEEMIGFGLNAPAKKEMYVGITRGLLRGLKKSLPDLEEELTTLSENLAGFSSEKKKARVKAVESLVKFPLEVREALLGHLWSHPEEEVRIAIRPVLESLPEDSEVRRNIIERDMIMAKKEDAIWEKEFIEEKEE